MCAGNELFFVALYLIKWDHTPVRTLLPDSLVISPLFLRLFASNGYLVRLTLAQLFAGLTFPIALGKNIINIVQAWKASKVLVGVDLRERKLLKEKERTTAAAKAT
jgi:CDP-diacylglycerol--inositol 3-phosphatidyltransferase